jgi:hypothetical protein
LLAHRFGFSLIRIGHQWIFSNPNTGATPAHWTSILECRERWVDWKCRSSVCSFTCLLGASRLMQSLVNKLSEY